MSTAICLTITPTCYIMMEKEAKLNKTKQNKGITWLTSHVTDD
jgi:hypothetical protein